MNELKVDLNRSYKFRNSGQEFTGIPIIAANMDTIGTFEMASALNKVILICHPCVIDILFFQHNCFTAVHKHYTAEEWKNFAAKDPDILKVFLFLKKSFIFLKVANKLISFRMLL